MTRMKRVSLLFFVTISMILSQLCGVVGIFAQTNTQSLQNKQLFTTSELLTLLGQDRGFSALHTAYQKAPEKVAGKVRLGGGLLQRKMVKNHPVQFDELYNQIWRQTVEQSFDPNMMGDRFAKKVFAMVSVKELRHVQAFWKSALGQKIIKIRQAIKKTELDVFKPGLASFYKNPTLHMARPVAKDKKTERYKILKAIYTRFTDRANTIDFMMRETEVNVARYSLAMGQTYLFFAGALRNKPKDLTRRALFGKYRRQARQKKIGTVVGSNLKSKLTELLFAAEKNLTSFREREDGIVKSGSAWPPVKVPNFLFDKRFSIMFKAMSSLDDAALRKYQAFLNSKPSLSFHRALEQSYNETVISAYFTFGKQFTARLGKNRVWIKVDGEVYIPPVLYFRMLGYQNGILGKIRHNYHDMPRLLEDSWDIHHKYGSKFRLSWEKVVKHYWDLPKLWARFFQKVKEEVPERDWSKVVTFWNSALGQELASLNNWEILRSRFTVLHDIPRLTKSMIASKRYKILASLKALIPDSRYRNNDDINAHEIILPAQIYLHLHGKTLETGLSLEDFVKYVKEKRKDKMWYQAIISKIFFGKEKASKKAGANNMSEKELKEWMASEHPWNMRVMFVAFQNFSDDDLIEYKDFLASKTNQKTIKKMTLLLNDLLHETCFLFYYQMLSERGASYSK